MEDNRDVILKLIAKLKELGEVLTPTTLGLTTSDIVDALNSTATDKCLSAKQGKVLNDKFADYIPDDNIVDNLTTNDATKVLSAKQGKVLNDMWQGLGICTVDDLLLTFDANSKMSDGHVINTITGGVVSSSNVYSVIATMGGTALSPFYNGAKTQVYFLKPEVVDQQVQYNCNLIFFYTKS